MNSQFEQALADPGIAGTNPYAVCVPGALPVHQIAFVDTIHRKFLHAMERRLGTALEIPVSAEQGTIEQAPFAEFVSASEPDACMIPLIATPGGDAILELSPGFVHGLLNVLIGAPENAQRPGRSITGIERHILRECFEGMVAELKAAWSAQGVTFDCGTPMEPETSPVLEGSAVVITALFTFAGVQEPIRLALPALLVRLAAKEANAAPVQSHTTARPLLLAAMRTATLRVEAILGGASLRMGDLLALEPGQVLTLGPPAKCSVDCVINGVSKFRAELISNGQCQALQIVLPIEPRTNFRD